MPKLVLLLSVFLAACQLNAPDYSDDDSTIDASTFDSGPCAPACNGDELTTCEDETPITETCNLGCGISGGPHCLQIVPSNAIPLTELDGITGGLTVTAGDHTLNSDTGSFDDLGLPPGTGYSMPEGTLAIGVLSVDSFTIDPGATLTITGTKAIVILSRGDVAIHGVIDAAARPAVTGTCPTGAESSWSCPGPGGGFGARNASTQATGCAGGGDGTYTAGNQTKVGGGGGGFGQAGADSGNVGGVFGAGGTISSCPVPGLIPLQGGSGGGGARQSTGSAWSSGGAGGGAVQITSLTSITFSEVTGVTLIDVGGGGGQRTANISDGDAIGGGAGGGAGGAILLEAPNITIDTARIYAGGGGGGTGKLPASPGSSAPGDGNGQSGLRAPSAALGGLSEVADTADGGNGGYVLGLTEVVPETGAGGAVGSGTGGGGGGIGVIRFNTMPGGLSESGVEMTAVVTRAAIELE